MSDSTFACPRCGFFVEPVSSGRGSRLVCTECGHRFFVGDREGISERRATPRRPSEPDEIDDLVVLKDGPGLDDETELDFPWLVVFSGIIWILAALMIFGSMVANVILMVMLQRGRDVSGLGIVFYVMVAIGFLTVGINCVRRVSEGLRGGIIGSFFFGLPCVIGGVVLYYVAATVPDPEQSNFCLFAGLFVGILGSFLTLAGIQAIVGRTAFEEWCEATQSRNEKRAPRRRIQRS